MPTESKTKKATAAKKNSNKKPLKKTDFDKKILFATSEAVPYIKTGGLADVAGALPKALNDRGIDCRVITSALYGYQAGTFAREWNLWETSISIFRGDTSIADFSNRYTTG